MENAQEQCSKHGRPNKEDKVTACRKIAQKLDLGTAHYQLIGLVGPYNILSTFPLKLVGLLGPYSIWLTCSSKLIGFVGPYNIYSHFHWN